MSPTLFYNNKVKQTDVEKLTKLDIETLYNNDTINRLISGVGIRVGSWASGSTTHGFFEVNGLNTIETGGDATKTTGREGMDNDLCKAIEILAGGPTAVGTLLTYYPMAGDRFENIYNGNVNLAFRGTTITAKRISTEKVRFSNMLIMDGQVPATIVQTWGAHTHPTHGARLAFPKYTFDANGIINGQDGEYSGNPTDGLAAMPSMENYVRTLYNWAVAQSDPNSPYKDKLSEFFHTAACTCNVGSTTNANFKNYVRDLYRNVTQAEVDALYNGELIPDADLATNGFVDVVETVDGEEKVTSKAIDQRAMSVSGYVTDKLPMNKLLSDAKLCTANLKTRDCGIDLGDRNYNVGTLLYNFNNNVDNENPDGLTASTLDTNGETLSLEPIGAFAKKNDKIIDLVNSLIDCLLLAYIRGITKETAADKLVDTNADLSSDDKDMLVTGKAFTALGLPEGNIVEVIKAIGNYQEVIDSNTSEYFPEPLFSGYNTMSSIHKMPGESGLFTITPSGF